MRLPPKITKCLSGKEKFRFVQLGRFLFWEAIRLLFWELAERRSRAAALPVMCGRDRHPPVHGRPWRG